MIPNRFSRVDGSHNFEIRPLNEGNALKVLYIAIYLSFQTLLSASSVFQFVLPPQTAFGLHSQALPTYLHIHPGTLKEQGRFGTDADEEISFTRYRFSWELEFVGSLGLFYYSGLAFRQSCEATDYSGVLGNQQWSQVIRSTQGTAVLQSCCDSCSLAPPCRCHCCLEHNLPRASSQQWSSSSFR